MRRIIIVNNEKFSITLLGVVVPALVVTQEQYSESWTGQY